MRSRGALSVIFKIPKCTFHLGIGLVLSHSRNDSCWEASLSELGVRPSVTREIHPAISNVTEYQDNRVLMLDLAGH